MKSDPMFKKKAMDAMRNAVNADYTTEETLQIAVAKAIWAIAGVSPEHGNVVMDLLGIKSYLRISEIQKK